ncbi:MAG: cohesin domain-containing protein [Minisyncoccia bacterium]
MQNAFREWRLVLYASILFVVLPQTALAADLTFSPTSGSHAIGEEFSVQVMIEPKESVNAADGTITFDAATLSVASISKEGSKFSLWTAEPEFSNSAGTISFSGGTPTPFSAKSTVITIKFKGKKAGDGALAFSKGSVLAADGKGTDVYGTGGTAKFTITEGAAPSEAPADGEATSEVSEEDVLPIAPVVTSQSHGKEEQWYSTTTADFAWKLTADVTGVRTLFTVQEEGVPDKLLTATSTTERIIASGDGVWYFFVQFKNDFGWGKITKRKVQIDTVPPSAFEIGLVDGDVPKFSLNATDDLSGVDRYEIQFDGSTVGTVKVAEFVDGQTPVPPQPGGSKKVTIKAYDKAGNASVAEKTLDLPLVEKASAKAAETEEGSGLVTFERILTVLFALGIGALAVMNYYGRKNAQEQKVMLLTAVSEVRDKNDKVFSAMREEFEQMVNDYDIKPQLSPQERDFLEKIKEVLDLSEELIDTGIEDLKKKMRGQ